MNLQPRTLDKLRTGALGLFLLVCGVTGSAAGPSTLTANLPNGISVRVFTPDYFLVRTIYQGTRGVISLASGERLSVITDTGDPAIGNQGDGTFHPFAADQVLGLLAEIDHPGLELTVDVYLLPFPRADIPGSSSAGRVLYLSPHVNNISRSTAAYIVAHEMGHVFQNRYLPQGSLDGWDTYRRIRGIEDRQRYSDSSSHADRPREILAEDFRVLFGGPDAYFDGYIENTGLALPGLVPGLKAFLAALKPVRSGSDIVAVGSHPNPFNPETVVRVKLDSDTPLGRFRWAVSSALFSSELRVLR